MKDHRNGSLYWYGLDMNSGWRTGWIEGSHEGCGKPLIFPNPMVLDMTHKTTK
ncbi:hypothetical protein F2Q70_00022025 [Brassica cretica]|uniref:Uncharacterized protein n=1 Tax=Brassica cretica TaxID=69181 RepID=A0A8S9GRK3_BRACR|nr:hypothetical protein F2Q70_00022025 [Brassica cretica]KAF3493267.1 hypothetical protein DY000_02053192 [Brassica cretica]